MSTTEPEKTATEVAAELLDMLKAEAISATVEDGVLSLRIDIDQDGWVEVVHAALDGFVSSSPSAPTEDGRTPEDVAAEYAPFDGSDPDTVIFLRGVIATAIRDDRASRRSLVAPSECSEPGHAGCEWVGEMHVHHPAPSSPGD